MKKVTLFILIVMLSASRFAEIDTFNVRGIVTSMDDGQPFPGVNVIIKGTSEGTVTDFQGIYEIEVRNEKTVLQFSSIGFLTEEITVGKKREINVRLSADVTELQEVITISHPKRWKSAKVRAEGTMAYDMAAVPSMGYTGEYAPEPFNTEGYATIHENIFLEPLKNPLSTFSIDVDAASYSNMRRFINNGQRPPRDAVRIEEMINYFIYDYKQPAGDAPFSINTELSSCPWNAQHRLVHVGLQGKKIPTENLPASNLVFLLDVSGSMQSPNKLPLLKSAFKMLVDELRPEDRVAIVVYAGAAGLVLPSTPGDQKGTIYNALNQLEAGGSTAGGAGLKLAYKVAKQNFAEDGNNRIILATDGDFNIGNSSNAEMERLIEIEREKGVFMTVLGFGMGNYKDDKMEIIADKGNGNYAYIDNLQEARKVLVNEFGGTLFTIAKDVKIQIEFNPTKVQAYRLIGYENRKLKAEDFNDDKKDAGELGSGHTVTALYEIIPVGIKSEFIGDVDDLKYQDNKIAPKSSGTNELMTVKFRYKDPEGSKSKLISHIIMDRDKRLSDTSDNFRWSAAVASFGMILRESEFKGNADFDSVIELAKNAKGEDKEGYRSEFLKLVRSSRYLAAR